jgi:lipoprotein-anchoring transpeptidase ErfK/SrfK
VVPAPVVIPVMPPVFDLPTNAAPVAAGSGPGEGIVRDAPPLKLSTERMVATQLALARRGISSGSIDGVAGSQTRAALRVFQKAEGIPVTGEPDAATLRRLGADASPYATYTVTADDVARLGPVPKTWLGKAGRSSLGYESVLELVAERFRSHPRLIRALNPEVDWQKVGVGRVVRVPAMDAPPVKGRAAFLRISLSEKTLRAFDAASNLLVHFPCSIARKVEKRPVGTLRVARIAPNPNYRFDPDIFPESPEARRIGRRLMIPPGPNNPVGTAWIGLDRPGYGIHGTPNPEEVGRTESHGCFRLSNWNAEHLIKLVWIGMPVHVEP